MSPKWGPGSSKKGVIGIPKVSSTEVKRNLSNRWTGLAEVARVVHLDKNLNPKVLTYIKEHGFYDAK